MTQYCLTYFLGWLADRKWGWLTQLGIKIFIKLFQVNMEEAMQPDCKHYSSFNAFFIRQLKKDARPIDLDPKTITSPIDGTISELGLIKQEKLLQAKNHFYTVPALLGKEDSFSNKFYNGNFLTGYLAPKDYHRFHMPCDGRLIETRYIPGKLFSVAPSYVDRIPQLFAQNERVICLFQTNFGLMAFIAIGALVVGNISLKHLGRINPKKSKKNEMLIWHHLDAHLFYKKGEELGLFELGSTIIMLFETQQLEWQPTLQSGSTLKLGQVINQ